MENDDPSNIVGISSIHIKIFNFRHSIDLRKNFFSSDTLDPNGWKYSLKQKFIKAIK